MRHLPTPVVFLTIRVVYPCVKPEKLTLLIEQVTVAEPTSNASAAHGTAEKLRTAVLLIVHRPAANRQGLYDLTRLVVDGRSRIDWITDSSLIIRGALADQRLQTTWSSY